MTYGRHEVAQKQSELNTKQISADQQIDKSTNRLKLKVIYSGPVVHYSLIASALCKVLRVPEG